MISSDTQVLTVDDFRSGIDSLKVYIDGKLAEFSRSSDKAHDELKTEIRINAVRIEEVKNVMNWDFATLAIVVAVVGFTITLAPMFREIFQREKKPELTEQDIRRRVREEIAQSAKS